MSRPIGFLLACVVLCSAILTPVSVASAEVGPITLQVVGGLAGRSRESSWTHLTVTVTNHGRQDLKGNVVARVPGNLPSQLSRTEYRFPVILPAGSRKTISIPTFLTLSFGPQVEFEHEGQVLARVPAQVTIMSKEIVLAGALTDEPGAFQSLTAARIPGRQRVEVIPLTAEIVPEDPLLLEPLDVIAVGRYDTGKLSQKQRQALTTWVQMGGLLVISAGPEWRSTLGGLPEALLPIGVADTTRRSSGELADFGGAPLSGDVPVVVGSLRHGSALVSDGGLPLITLSQSGRGHVIFLSFDTTLEPIHGWSGMQAVWEQLLTPLSLVSASVNNNRFLGPPLPTTGITGALERMPVLGLPRSGTLVGLLLAYMIAIGPGAYLLLRRVDRREWAWGAIPLIAFLTVGSVYVVGFRSQDAGMHHTITVTEVMPDAHAIVRTYIGVFAPARDTVKMTLPAGHLASGLVFGQTQQAVDGVSTKVRYEQQTNVEVHDPDKWGLKGLHVIGQGRLQGALELQVTGWSGGRLTGTVTNGTGAFLEDVTAVSAIDSYRIGDMKAGETRTVSISIGDAGGGSPALQFSRTFSSDPTEMRRRDVLAHLFSHMRDADSPLQVTVLGWTEEQVVKMPALKGMGRPLATTNLVYARFLPELQLASDHIPPGVLMGRLVNTQSAQTPAVTPQGLKASTGIYGFEFVMPPLNRKSVAEVWLHFGSPGSAASDMPYEIQMHNWKTNQWVALPTVQEQALIPWADLVPPNGVVSMRLDVKQDVDIRMPMLSVKGVPR